MVNSNKNGHTGFTLIELLVASLILAMLITAIGAVLAAGIRTWQTARDHLRLEAGGLPGLAVWERDLMNAEPFYAGSDTWTSGDRLPLHGSSDEIIIPATVVASANYDGFVPGYVRYWFDPRERAILRETWLFDELPPERAEIWIENVDSLTISYLDPDDLAASTPRQATGAGKESWDNEVELPAAVVLTLKLSASGAPEQTWRRTVVLPRAIRQRGIADY